MDILRCIQSNLYLSVSAVDEARMFTRALSHADLFVYARAKVHRRDGQGQGKKLSMVDKSGREKVETRLLGAHVLGTRNVKYSPDSHSK